LSAGLKHKRHQRLEKLECGLTQKKVSEYSIPIKSYTKKTFFEVYAWLHYNSP